MFKSASCLSDSRRFCFVCSNYIPEKNPSSFSGIHLERYRRRFGEPENANRDFVGTGLCGKCERQLLLFDRNQEYDLSPVTWTEPLINHSNCHICNCQYVNCYKIKKDKKYKLKHSKLLEKGYIIYSENTNVIKN